jgi:hypothetical protein
VVFLFAVLCYGQQSKREESFFIFLCFLAKVTVRNSADYEFTKKKVFARQMLLRDSYIHKESITFMKKTPLSC